VEYQRIAAAGFFSLPSTDALWVSWNGAGTEKGGLVFGTLLGPETTGPGFWLRDLCFWFPGCTDHARWFLLLGGAGVWGVWYGVVV